MKMFKTAFMCLSVLLARVSVCQMHAVPTEAGKGVSDPLEFQTTV